jgi:hypothetical protein
MPLQRSILALFFFVFALINLRADDATIIASVRAVDDARVAAMVAVDPNKLAASLSDQLHYAHSVRLIQTKAEFIATLTSKSLIYQNMEYRTRDFSVAAPGVVVMKGRALVKVGTKEMIFLVDINFLGVWRLENDQWRLYAWQSSRNERATPIGPPAAQ